VVLVKALGNLAMPDCRPSKLVPVPTLSQKNVADLQAVFLNLGFLDFHLFHLREINISLIIGEIIHNYSETKKLDLTIGISYDSNVDKAIQIVRDIVTADKRVAMNPVPKIGISEFADSSINIYSRLWCKQSDYWDIIFSSNKKIYEEFAKNNINIPFPQRDVHVYDIKK